MAGKTFVRYLFYSFFTLLLVLCIYSFYIIRDSFPRLKGKLKIVGLQRPVEICRDRYGVPHIYASSVKDLFFAQGYVHSQDRFWQMDVWRHAGAGRLSEMFGKSQVKTDHFLRTLGWHRVVKKELAVTDPYSMNILKSYSAGVNAYLAEHSGSELSLEYALLKLVNPAYKPEPWVPSHTLTWGKVMAWDLGMNLSMEIQRAVLRKYLTAEQVEELYPPYPSFHPLIVSSPWNPGPVYLLSGLASEMENVPRFFGRSEEGIGSNNWVISGLLTTSGKPLLANDTHLSQQMPSIWYTIGLHCQPKTEECPFDVVGFSFAGVPGVIIGHNDRIAWGFTNLGPDVMDLYIEKVHPDDPDLYEVNGQWKKMEIINDEIKVAGGQSIPVRIRLTRHGPILSDSYAALQEFEKKAGVQLPARYAIALRWTALEPTDTFPAIWKVNLARNWQEFRAAAAEFDVPSQNIVYADVEGNIGYQVPGLIPIRSAGDGRYPVPGWTDDFEWKGYIPFAELPSLLNPSSGYIATANNAVVDDHYPYFITHDWDYGFRASRIVEMIEKARGKIDITYVQRMQGDNKNQNGQALIPILLNINFQDETLRKAKELLAQWDAQQRSDSSATALFEVFWRNLLAETFHDELPDRMRPTGGSRWVEVMRRLVEDPRSFWWDNKRTANIETRDDIFALAFRKAVVELRLTLGDQPSHWEWGKLHNVTFTNETLGASGIRFMELLLNRGPFPVSGATVAINATSWNASSGNYRVTALPAMRMIIDFSDFDRSLFIHTTGQSGHAYHENYIDMANPWRNIQYAPLPFTRQAIEKNTVNHLILEPAPQ